MTGTGSGSPGHVALPHLAVVHPVIPNAQLVLVFLSLFIYLWFVSSVLSFLNKTNLAHLSYCYSEYGLETEGDKGWCWRKQQMFGRWPSFGCPRVGRRTLGLGDGNPIKCNSWDLPHCWLVCGSWHCNDLWCYQYASPKLTSMTIRQWLMMPWTAKVTQQPTDVWAITTLGSAYWQHDTGRDIL